MQNINRPIIGILCLTGLLTTAASAQNPTFSLEVAAINSIPLPTGTAAHISAMPGDTLTLEVFLRDWSPDGEQLRAYQAKVDRDSYLNGVAGNIQPVDFDNTTAKGDENKKNCFINREDPRYIFSGVQDFGIVDTRSYGYRWLGVLVNPEDSRASTQNGKKYYCGTVHMRVSSDAAGSFRLRLHTSGKHSALRGPENIAIIPLDFEDAIVDVMSDALRTVSSNPSNEAIDARGAGHSLRGGAPRSSVRSGWDRVEFSFSGSVAGLSKADFKIDDGSTSPPSLVRLILRDSVAVLVLDKGISLGRWTTIVHTRSGTGTRIGFLPGDVNADGVTDIDDVLALTNPPDYAEPLPAFQTDIDSDGHTGVTDVLRIIDILTEPGAYRPVRLILKPR